MHLDGVLYICLPLLLLQEAFQVVSFFFFFGHVACGILVPQPGMEPVPPAVEAHSLNHWTGREVLSWFSWGSSRPLPQLRQVEPPHSLHTHLCMGEQGGTECGRGRGTGLVAGGHASGSLPGGQVGSASAGLRRHLWASFSLSLKCPAASLVLKLCPGGILFMDKNQTMALFTQFREKLSTQIRFSPT